MALQVSRNGTYMFGHDYAVAHEEGKAHFGVLLLSRSERGLSMPMEAMRLAQRELLNLDQRVDADELESARQLPSAP